MATEIKRKICTTCSAVNLLFAPECWNCQVPFGQVARYVDADMGREYWLPRDMTFEQCRDGGRNLCAVSMFRDEPGTE